MPPQGVVRNEFRLALAERKMRLEEQVGDLGRGAKVWSALARTLTARRGLVALLVIVLVSLALRVHVSRECSLWVDEAITRRGVLKPWYEVLKGPSETHPPLMYWLVAPWSQLFDGNETALRAVSLLFGCVLLAATYELCLELRLSVGRSLLVVATLALSPFFIRHATEARHYAMVTAFVTLATTRTLRCLRPERRTRDVFGFALAALAAGATHYFGVAYAFALLGVLLVGLAQGWKKGQLPQWRSVLTALLGLLMGLGYLTTRMLAVAHSYSASTRGAENQLLFDQDLLFDILREFSFMTSPVWAIVLQPALVLTGLLRLSLELRGLARLLPLAIGAAPCAAAPFITADHYVAARYVAPSLVFYHLAACVALFGAIDRVRHELASGPRAARAVAVLGWLGLACLLFARLYEYPKGFGAGGDDYRGLQRYFTANLGKDTRLIAYDGGFARLLLTKFYPIGSRPLPLDKFSLLPDVERYLVIEIHVDGPERRAEFESLVEERLGLSVEEWRALPLVPLPHSVYQTPVPARLVHLNKASMPKRRPRNRR